MSNLRPSQYGELNCTVSVPKRDGGIVTSDITKVANVFIDTPILETNKTSIQSDQIEFTLYGHNFDRVPSGNEVKIESHCVSNFLTTCPSGCDPTLSSYPEEIITSVCE
jgi:hypothetical protein